MRYAILVVLLLAPLAACSDGDTGTSEGPRDIVGPDVTVPGGDTLDGGAQPDPGATETVEPELPQPEGDFGEPCSANEDCESGWCVQGAEGHVCTQECTDACPEGYDCKSIISPTAAIVFLCIPEFQKFCDPCAEDKHCEDGACLWLDDEGRCAYPCESDDDCPSTYVCLPDPGDAHLGTWCQPKTASCTCNAFKSGGIRTCQLTNDHGTCYGLQVCKTSAGWTPCSAADPEPELCDGVDNDCNGLIDDELVDGEGCTNDLEGVGSCPGVSLCLGSEGWICQGQTPTVEACDVQDNDCDGQIDEDFKDATGSWTLDGHCGYCGNDCTDKIPNGTGVCGGTPDAPVCVVASCDPGYIQFNTFQCLPPVDLTCLACVDDGDCLDGTCHALDTQPVCVMPCDPDEGCPEGTACAEVEAGVERCLPVTGTCTCTPAKDGDTRPCQVTTDYGTCLGIEQCDAAVGWVGCTAGSAEEEVCDGLDNDCDGVIDDELAGLGGPCENTIAGVGSCTGVQACAGAGGWLCQGPVPAAEVCDFEDNNCDGAVDETFTDAAGSYTTDANCGTCGLDCTDLVVNGTGMCGGTPDAPMCVVASCDPGYYQVGSLACLLAGDDLCVPCLSDDACPNPGDLCLAQSDGSYCGRDCAAGNVYGTPAGDCPSGFVCLDLGGGVEQCVPPSGTCTCQSEDTGAVRACLQTTQFGTCYGQETCDPALGWVGCTAGLPEAETCSGLDDDCNGLVDDVAGRGDACSVDNAFGSCPGLLDCVAAEVALQCLGNVPAAEACNFLDDDCDGATDEDFPLLLTSCNVGVGSCQRFGVYHCAADAGSVACSVVAGEPAAELCDNLDNNCDGATDEAFAAKGTVCTAGTGACKQSGVVVCSADGAGTECTAEAGAQSAELCDGLDNDCDSETDEGFPAKGSVCQVGAGACQNTGLMVCSEDGLNVQCTASEGVQGDPESCDQLDNDCDGLTDEDFGDKNTVCVVGVGVCERSGVMVCTADGGGTQCSVAPGNAGTDVCDGLDNDCDGAADEDYPDLATVCTAGVGACQTAGTRICAADGLATMCSATPGAQSPEGCNGIDDDCDGDTDEDFTDLGAVCSAGVGACLGIGTAVCTADGSATECSAVVGQPQLEICNGLDDDCNGAVDETFSTLGTICTVGEGACRSTGVRICTADGSGAECSATAGTPSAETCNGLDDDCNGGTDEPFAAVGTVCTVGVGACKESGTMDCAPDGSGVVCSAVEGTPSPELCDGLDNNCDGAADEVYPDLATVCTAGVGACLAVGTRSCAADGLGTVCGATPGAGSAESCNSIDDNCDGATDEDFTDLGTLCSAGVGACLGIGTVVCAADGSATECSAIVGQPEPEACNGLDDDCNGAVDEVFPTLGTVCTVGEGACRSVGVQICTADGAGTECSATAGTPSAETCNGLDDDCNGGTDEPFAAVGTVCTVGVGVCKATDTMDCTPDGSGVVCSALEGTPSAELCDGLDNDCNDTIDDGFDLGQPCTAGVGACLVIGTLECTADGLDTACSATPGTPSAESCDGIDNDCNGTIDDGFDRGQPCTAGVGACLVIGTLDCTPDGLGTTCNATPGTPATEACDGIDNNCDGAIDDGFGLGAACDVGTGVCQAFGLTICSADATGIECSATEGSGGSEVCDNLDNNCDGQTDEGGAWDDKGDTCVDGVGACIRAGVRVCDPAAPDGPTRCNAVPGDPVAETCNDVDDDCDGTVDNGADWDDKGVVCSAGLGTCERFGVYVCDAAAPDGPTTCNATAATPNPAELCDYADDDCDGQTDEDFRDAGGNYVDLGNCGSCGNDCSNYWNEAVHHATPFCDDLSAPPKCDYDCVTTPVPYGDGDGIPDNGCEMPLDAAAVYVSMPANGGVDGIGCGGWGNPCATIGWALNLAANDAAKVRVYVSGGAYYGNITLAPGIDLLGGYNPVNWARDPAVNITVIYGATAAPADPDDRAVVTAVDIQGQATELSGFVVYGEVVAGLAGNSYGIYVQDCDDALALRDNVIYAGNGGSGVAGTDGDQGAAGIDGDPGTAAHDDKNCPNDAGDAEPQDPGGVGGQQSCAGADVSGGRGGQNFCPDYDESGAGFPTTPYTQNPAGAQDGQQGFGASGGDGGATGFDSFSYNTGTPPGCSCVVPPDKEPAIGEAGGHGSHGGPGSGGAGCNQPNGGVVGTRWVGSIGSPGTGGAPGSGGGGGGTGGGVENWDCNNDGDHDVGGSGGGGGSGGCGGDTGTGGAAGGGSFGIFMVFTAAPAAAPVVVDNVVNTGRGGTGGAGGNGGVGGFGGTGAPGGAEGANGSKEWCAPHGGRGGEGGNGGHGGGAGGGCGGASYGIFAWGQGGLNLNPISNGNTVILSGAGGDGGPGGISLAADGDPGDPGTEAATNF